MAAPLASGLALPKGGPALASLKMPSTPLPDPDTIASAISNKLSDPPRAASQTEPLRRPTRPIPSDFLSDKATTALIRRVLCGQNLADRGKSTPAPIHDLLPPLTSRNDVDLQLYALIAIIVKEFVQSWYTKITPDETFVAEIVQIIAHCTRALEQRLRKVDLESLLFDELPELLDAHVRAYRAAKSSIARQPVEANPREIYHSLWPIPALTPVPGAEHESADPQADNESAYRQLLVQGVLAVLLPTEDLANGCLTALVGQLFSELIIGNLVANRLSEPWLIWEGLIILTRVVRTNSATRAPGSEAADRDVNHGAEPGKTPPAMAIKRGWSVSQVFWSIVQWGFVAVSVLRFIINAIVLSQTLPPRPTLAFISQADPTSQGATKEPQHHPSGTFDLPSQPVKVPVANFKIWSCIGNLLEMDARMPWMHGALSMIQWAAIRGPGNLAGLNGMIDRLLSHYIQAYVLDPTRLPPLLRAARSAVFPNNAPGTPSLIPPSSDEQLAALRRRCASALLALVPRGVGSLYYGSSTWPWSSIWASPQRSAIWRSGPRTASSNSAAHSNNTKATGEEVARVRLADEGESAKRGHATLTPGSKRQFGETGVRPTKAGGDHQDQADMCYEGDEDDDRILSQIETGILDVFSDPYCNKHLVYGILELVLVRLMPELTEKGVIELWEERVS
ncbi:PXA domain-containing protein [Durotheca rogersii]|uniref:PXA domain-containing protein n=1 Tax=Durotheca rogersii TaxID=419775 RepID=UPI00221EB069|nr:PXA domain-containing protein [Durotheca rogersii]KAI5868020.1 PXA domain-containing protein [Durotheca rogersii]